MLSLISLRKIVFFLWLVVAFFTFITFFLAEQSVAYTFLNWTIGVAVALFVLWVVEKNRKTGVVKKGEKAVAEVKNTWNRSGGSPKLKNYVIAQAFVYLLVFGGLVLLAVGESRIKDLEPPSIWVYMFLFCITSLGIPLLAFVYYLRKDLLTSQHIGRVQVMFIALKRALLVALIMPGIPVLGLIYHSIVSPENESEAILGGGLLFIWVFVAFCWFAASLVAGRAGRNRA